MSWMSILVSALVTTKPFLSSTGWCSSTSEMSAITAAGERGQHAAVVVPQVGMLQQIGTPFIGTAQGLGAPPACNGAVIAAAQYAGDRHIAEHWWSGVLRVFEQSVTERLDDGRVRPSEHAGNQAADRIDDDERRHLTAGEDEVTNGDLLVDEGTDALVHAFIAAAHQRDLWPLRQSARLRLRERAPLRRQENAPRPASGAIECLERRHQRLHFHNHAVA